MDISHDFFSSHEAMGHLPHPGKLPGHWSGVSSPCPELHTVPIPGLTCLFVVPCLHASVCTMFYPAVLSLLQAESIVAGTVDMALVCGQDLGLVSDQ